MKCLSALINDRYASGSLVLLGLLLTGCQSAPRPAPLRTVHADLDVLVANQPEWSGVARYDQTLTLLDQAVRQAQPGMERSLSPLSLPAQTGLLPGAAYTMPAVALQQERRQLAAQQQAQIERLRQRRLRVRRQQIALQQSRWRAEAQRLYAQAVQAAQDRYNQRFSDAFTTDSARRLNLILQINVLQKTVADWNLSTPPTPLLEKAKQDLAEKSALLVRLTSQQTGALADLRRQRDAALSLATDARKAYVVQQRVLLDATLTAQDEAALGIQRELLRRQTASLLQQEKTLASAVAPAVGSLGPMSLVNPGPAFGSAPVEDLKAAEKDLRVQRARWVELLYEDTRAAVLDIARQRGWTVMFGTARPGEPDVTRQLVPLLVSRAGQA